MIIVFAVNLPVTAVTVVIHDEFIYRRALLVPKLKLRHRFRSVPGVFGALTGPLLITWTASFPYLEMRCYRTGDRGSGRHRQE